MEKLPKTLHELLRMAVVDARALQDDPRYRLDMGVWHVGGRVQCHVCMAGAVMARRLDVDPTYTQIPNDLEDADHAKALYAIDLMRLGSLGEAFRELRGPATRPPSGLRDCGRMIRDMFDPELGRAPWDVYEKAVDALEHIGA